MSRVKMNWTVSAEVAASLGPGKLMRLAMLEEWLNGREDNAIADNAIDFFVERYNVQPCEAVGARRAMLLIQAGAGDIEQTIRDTSTPVKSLVEPPFDEDYDSSSVAMNCFGFWVGWTEWTGGGRDGRPDRMEKAPYFLEVVEEKEVYSIEYTFKKREVV